jgi:hypothetical protein
MVRQDPGLHLVLPLNEQACHPLAGVKFRHQPVLYNLKRMIRLRANGEQSVFSWSCNDGSKHQKCVLNCQNLCFGLKPYVFLQSLRLSLSQTAPLNSS